MSIFKGFEELENMNKAEVTEVMKEMVFPNRPRGGIKTKIEEQIVQRKTWQGEWYDHTLISRFSKEHSGPDMSHFRPKIDGNTYTWGELKAYPNALLKVFAYRMWQQKYGSEEE
tara:strand:- start:773 stop:1114 length:342 start_codon:yes stop_codon:yes gene_type:complete